MRTRRLGRTDLAVTEICLGTMTWGRQNTEAEGHAQMDYALERGVTFWDTAEMYAIPPTAETFGRTEEIIGSWLASRGGRDRIVLASKAVGRSPGGFGWVRDGQPRLDRANLVRAVEDSLRRLRTDYIDLYQLHWPDRSTNRFGARGFALGDDEGATPIAETLEALAGLVRAGKIRHVGLSNESAWGVMTYLRAAELHGYSRIVSIQNAYSLLNRTFEGDLAEVAIREQVGLLAYSPLAAGTLTGKYLDGRMPEGTRRAIDHRKSRYARVNADAATRRYLEIARRHGLDPAQMAIAFVLSQPFVTAAIIGATTMDHLKTNIAAGELRLSAEVLAEIEEAHEAIPDPCP
ncbi:NADP(H)-dependent aldo-keto reductase [Arenibaculum pallidiluteum]|uniref:NADP(H)-dependent aldo-keto reductase n=1 Tax=Arenibaculum pallidiluteum TaxID=2812559 RepID=UPI001A968B9D|nr:NADP(H)-dependent aldo-keto reductase [Arenibaculum pallidiluteum]